MFDTLDRIIDLDPATIVPGHGAVRGIDAVRQEQAYFHHVFDEARKYFEAGLTSEKAAERVDLGPYGEWKALARLVIHVERAYREYRNKPTGAPWELPRIFDGMYAWRRQKAPRWSSNPVSPVSM